MIHCDVNFALNPGRGDRVGRENYNNVVHSVNAITNFLNKGLANLNLGFIQPIANTLTFKIRCKSANEWLIGVIVTEKYGWKHDGELFRVANSRDRQRLGGPNLPAATARLYGYFV
ncbi:hypothetical protein CBM2633_A110072 [Cupriavidus taiwanensis]|nr:hypothetical protein CBM2633_A110072 [Cupriavidus taiwanensis]